MNKNIEIPDWIGKTNVSEDRETTLELLRVFANLLGEPLPYFNAEQNDDDFLKDVCDIANRLDYDIEKDVEPLDIGVLVGFTRTPIGRFNAELAGRVWLLKRALEENDA